MIVSRILGISSIIIIILFHCSECNIVGQEMNLLTQNLLSAGRVMSDRSDLLVLIIPTFLPGHLIRPNGLGLKSIYPYVLTLILDGLTLDIVGPGAGTSAIQNSTRKIVELQKLLKREMREEVRERAPDTY